MPDALIWMAGALLSINIGVMAWVCIAIISMKIEVSGLSNTLNATASSHKDHVSRLDRFESMQNKLLQDVARLKDRARLEKRRFDEEDE